MAEEKKYIVQMPNEHFNGVRHAGTEPVTFVKGKAECTKKQAEIFVREKGYYCPELEEDPKDPETPKDPEDPETPKSTEKKKK